MTWQRFKSCTGSGLQVSKIIVMKNPHYVVVRSWPRYPLWLGTFIFMFTWIDTDTALVFSKRTQACLGMIKTPANGCCASYGLLAGHSASKARGHNSWIFMNTANCRYKQEEWFLSTQTWTLHGTASDEGSQRLREDFITEKAPTTRVFSWLKVHTSVFTFKTLC